jgi:hypothetical protein
MKLITEILMVIICFLLLLLSISLNVSDEKIIDCRLAEISPDIPVMAKEECRKLNIRKYNGV